MTVFSLVNLLCFPTSVSGSILTNVGALLSLVMVMEFFSGVVLSFSICGYNAGVVSKLNVLNSVYLGWLVFKLHSLLPNVIAMMMLLHIFNCLVNIVNSSAEVLISGVVLLLLFVGTAYTGYSLSSGAMGYWAVVVVNNLLMESTGVSVSSSLFFDSSIGLGVETFMNVFSYHFLLAGLILLIQGLHIFLLHNSGSSNFITSAYLDYFSFSSLMLVKDLALGVESLLFMFYNIFFNCFNMVFGENFLEINEFNSLELSVEWYVSIFFIVLSGICYNSLGLLFTLLFIIAVVLILLVSDLFSFECFKSYNFYIQVFIVSIIFVYLSYFGFSSYLIVVPVVLWIMFCLLLDMFFINSSLNCLNI